MWHYVSVCVIRGYPYLWFKRGLSIIGCMRTYAYNLAIMLVANTAIIYKFMRVKCQSKPNNTSESTNQALYKSATRGTAMVITVSMMFIILTSQVALDNATGSRLASNPLYYAFMIIMQYVNHSINGVLYCVVGSKFRTKLIKILRRRKRSETVSGENTRNDTDTGYVSETRY